MLTIGRRKADAMTLPDDLTEAAKEAKCLRFDNDGRQCLFADPRFTRVEWQSGHYVHPECAVTAVLRALPESETVVEELADVEHERWSKWMRWLYRNGKWNDDGSFTIEPDRAQRWRFLSQMTYADLSNETAPAAAWVEARTSLAAIAKLADNA